jgi:hypothetical protein
MKEIIDERDALREQLLQARSKLALAAESAAGEGELVRDLAAALGDIATSAEQHPAYLGGGLSIDEINAEGGDAAFVTFDIAYRARAALSKVTP